MGGRIILMASRALASAARGPDDYARVYDRILSQVKQPVIIHWLGEMFDPALAGYWGNADHLAAMDTCFDIIADHADKVDGIKISLLSKDKEIAHAPPPRQGQQHRGGQDVYRRRLQLCRAHRRRRGRLFGCAARHFRRHRAGRLRRAGAAGRGRRGGLPRHPCADRSAVAPHLQGADPLLQDRRRLPCLSQWPAGSFRDGRRPAERALAGASGRAVPPGRPGAGAARSRPCGRPHAQGAGGRRI